jgi:glutamate racemase
LDSGIGVLPYYEHFHHANPDEALVCLSDRAYFPYGDKERQELILRLSRLLKRVRGYYRPKLAVLACNTASVSALASLRISFPDLPLVGTVPAVKPAVLASRKRHIGVLGTARTIDDPYIAELVAQCDPDCKLTAIAAPKLVDFVEKQYETSGAGERQRAVLPYIEQFRHAGADAIVLGCTHFLFLQDAFKAAAEDMSIHDSVEGVSRRVEALLDQGGLRAEPGPPGRKGVLLVTGKLPLEHVWQKRAQAFGLRIRAGRGY